MRLIFLLLFAVTLHCAAEDTAPASAFSISPAASFEVDVNASIRRAYAIYPDCLVPGSKLHAALQQEVDRLAQKSSPILKDSTWPEFVCAKVAADLGIAPKTTAAK